MLLGLPAGTRALQKVGDDYNQTFKDLWTGLDKKPTVDLDHIWLNRHGLSAAFDLQYFALAVRNYF